MRSRAFSISILLLHLLGDAISPYIIGFVSKETNDLKLAVLLAPVAIGLAALTWIVGWSTLRDPVRAVRSGGVMTAVEGEGGETYEVMESHGGARLFEMSDLSYRNNMTSNDDDDDKEASAGGLYSDASGDDGQRVAFTIDPTLSKTGLSSYEGEVCILFRVNSNHA